MKITSMQKMIAATAGFVVLAVLAFVLLVSPMYSQLSDLASQKVAAEQQLQTADATLARLQDAKDRSASTEAQILQIGTEMPDSPQLPTVIMELQDIANEDNVSMTSFSPAQPVPEAGGKFTQIAITMQATSKWDDDGDSSLLNFLHDLNGSTRLLRVTNLTISPASSTSTSTAIDTDPDLTVGLTVNAYVMGTNGVISSSTTASGTAGQ